MNLEKRSGKIVKFDSSKIEAAINKAIEQIGKEEEYQGVASLIAKEAKDYFEKYEKINIEDVQDFVEYKLMEEAPLAAKAYITYRLDRARLRRDGWKMTDLQRDIYESKYQFNSETFEEFTNRVSGGNDSIAKLIRDKKFLPAGRILAGRGLDKMGRKITLSNCYVMPQVEDNIESIFDTAKWMARTYSYGGGVGLTINKLRPKGARVNNAADTTTGAVSFMDLYSMVTGLIGMKGRRGALMLNMDVTHPDIEEFIDAKSGDVESIQFANISVNMTDEFMEAVKNDTNFRLHFEVGDDAGGQVIEKEVGARDLFRKLAYNNWDNAEPGILYKDRIDSYHLMSEDPNFEYAGVNPCAEEPLPAFGSCNLSSINLGAYVKKAYTDDAYVDKESLAKSVHDGVKYLNEVLDENTKLHPLEEQKEVSANLRQIGLGIMGLADLFIKLDIKYGSKESLDLIHDLGSLIANEAIKASALLAKEEGPFPAYNESVLKSKFLNEVADKETLDLVKKYGLRNSQLLTIAPTGSISTLIGVSNGVEPIFQVSYTRKTQSINGGIETNYRVITPIVKEYMDARGLKNEEDLPDTIITTSNLNYKDRINVQAAWQKYIDASISSTVNLSKETTVDEVEDLYMYAWDQGLKGITVYRDGCRRSAILSKNPSSEESKLNIRGTTQEKIQILQNKIDSLIVESLVENPDQCPKCGGPMNHAGGCEECQDCGYSPCAI